MESYVEAIQLLNSRKSVPKAALGNMRGSDDMSEWLSILGHSDEDLRRLKVIHVAGTNGKGSTCAFASSFLTAHGNIHGYPQKVGLYTSPHMTCIRERICLNGKPISEECFTTRFFEIWAKLPHQATPELDIPRYLQFLALLAFHVFIMEKVDLAIVEAHMGGEWDATNVTKSPSVVGITTIAKDHVHLLGPTIEDIAWNKAGILKPNALAFSAIQCSAVTSVLRRRAEEKGASLEFVGINSALPRSAALVPRAQRINCSLALEIVRSWLSLNSPKYLDQIDHTIASGIELFNWPGRYQTISDGSYQWYLDGAHNESSLRYAVDWFANLVTHNAIRILVFSHFSNRDTSALLRTIAESLQSKKIQLQYVIFTSYDEHNEGKPRIGKSYLLEGNGKAEFLPDRNLTKRFSASRQEDNVATWKTLDPLSVIYCERTIQIAIDRARSAGNGSSETQILVTGSLHLVSGVIGRLKSGDGFS